MPGRQPGRLTMSSIIRRWSAAVKVPEVVTMAYSSAPESSTVQCIGPLSIVIRAWNALAALPWPTAKALPASIDTMNTIDTPGVPSGVQLAERVGAELADGYQRIKIKIRPGWDVVPVSRIRAAFGDVPLMVDANAAFTADEGLLLAEGSAGGPAEELLPHGTDGRRTLVPGTVGPGAGLLAQLRPE